MARPGTLHKGSGGKATVTVRKSANAPSKAPRESRRRRALADPWKPGQSGNPRGRLPGTRNRATLLAQALMERDLEAVVQKVVTAAKGGNLHAAKLIIERLVPPVRERPMSLELPDDVTSATGVNEAAATVLRALSTGELLPAEAEALSSILEMRRRTIETEEHEKRLQALESRGRPRGD